MHSEPVVLGECAHEMALDGPDKAIACAHSNMSAPVACRHHQYPTEGAAASQRRVIRQPR
jgi:hypothetical protein